MGFLGTSGFSDSLAPPGQWLPQSNVKACNLLVNHVSLSGKTSNDVTDIASTTHFRVSMLATISKELETSKLAESFLIQPVVKS